MRKPCAHVAWLRGPGRKDRSFTVILTYFRTRSSITSRRLTGRVTKRQRRGDVRRNNEGFRRPEPRRVPQARRCGGRWRGAGWRGGRAGVGAPARPEAFDAASTIKIGFVSPLTGPAAGFGEPDPYVIGLARTAFAKGLKIGGKTYGVQIIEKDSQSVPATAAQLAQQLISSSQVDLLLATSTPEVVNPVADAAEAGAVPCISTTVPWEAWYFGRGAKPGAPSPFKWTYHFCVRCAELRRQLSGPVEAGAKQQEGRRDVAERRGRQRDPREPRAPAAEGRLHDRRPGRLPGRHERLHLADHAVQGPELPDLQHLPDPARLHHLLAAGGAAGLHQDGEDRADRQDGAVRFAGGRGRAARLQPRHRRILGTDVAVQLLIDRSQQRAARRGLHQAHQPLPQPAGRRKPSRCSTSLLRR